MVKRLPYVFILIIYCLFCLLGCSKSTDVQTVNPAKPIVYTSIFPIYDFTQKIGGDKIEVINLLPAGTQAHSFEPSTKMMIKLSKASLFLYNGAGMEPYIEKFQATLKSSSLLMVDTSTGIELLEVNDHHHSHDHEKKNGSHEHGTNFRYETITYDPHIWLSPKKAICQAQNILKAIGEIDPLNQAYYERNFENLKENLLQLDQDYQSELAKCEKKVLVVSHAAFNYLCQDYGLTQIPVMGLSAEAEPTPHKMKEVIDLVTKYQLSCLFLEAVENPRAIKTIARETQTQTLILHPLGSLTAEEIKAGKDYFQIMVDNLANLKKGLG